MNGFVDNESVQNDSNNDRPSQGVNQQPPGQGAGNRPNQGDFGGFGQNPNQGENQQQPSQAAGNRPNQANFGGFGQNPGMVDEEEEDNNESSQDNNNDVQLGDYCDLNIQVNSCRAEKMCNFENGDNGVCESCEGRTSLDNCQNDSSLSSQGIMSCCIACAKLPRDQCFAELGNDSDSFEKDGNSEKIQ